MFGTQSLLAAALLDRVNSEAELVMMIAMHESASGTGLRAHVDAHRGTIPGVERMRIKECEEAGRLKV